MSEFQVLGHFTIEVQIVRKDDIVQLLRKKKKFEIKILEDL